MNNTKIKELIKTYQEMLKKKKKYQLKDLDERRQCEIYVLENIIEDLQNIVND